MMWDALRVLVRVSVRGFGTGVTAKGFDEDCAFLVRGLHLGEITS